VDLAGLTGYAVPTRLMALKYGAKLVWGPEVIDKAILHATRNVHPDTGVISYDGVSKAIFTTHPIEKPYLIYQIGTADPELAVQAAKTVVQDVSGFDLNCGCPKPFSTSGGMGAALLTEPDKLCSILRALRAFAPPEMPVTAKIRLLPSQEETLKLVGRIIETGISALTVHCRTRAMRREPALVERLRGIVDFVARSGSNIPVIENGDCLGYDDARRVREMTGAHSVMIATAAERNPSCFSPEPLVDLEETLVPDYLRLARYLDHNWGLTKFCVSQFVGSNPKLGKSGRKAMKQHIAQAKCFEDMEGVVDGWERGRGVFESICQDIRGREEAEEAELHTPDERIGLTPADVLSTPRWPANARRYPHPAGSDSASPTPSHQPIRVDGLLTWTAARDGPEPGRH